jgi:fumarylacetoacetate (FAA) hydrolase family protein
MALNSIDHLQTAKALLEKAAEQVQEAAKGPFLFSDEQRQGVIQDIERFRLTLSLMRRNRAVLSGAANRKRQAKPSGKSSGE